MASEMRLRIINFHGIGEPARILEPREADYWISVDRFRQVLDRIAVHPDRERLSLTFDDGNISDLSIALPELRQRGLRADFFVLVGRIGAPGSLSAEHIRALIGESMGIGSHGVIHCDWTSLPRSELSGELQASKGALESICGRAVLSASIPFGRYNATVLSALRKAGYEIAYSSDGDSAHNSAFLRPRTSIRRDTTDGALDALLTGNVPIWRRLRRGTAKTIKKWI